MDRVLQLSISAYWAKFLDFPVFMFLLICYSDLIMTVLVMFKQSPDGDIIDCVHISNQPAFDHPFLKDHKILVCSS